MITTKRTVLRKMIPNDAESVFRYRSDKTTNKYQGFIPETVEEVQNFISKIPEHINEPETWFQMVIIEIDSQRIIGDIGLHFYGNENKQVEIGCTLDKEYQNKGYASESLTSIMEYLFIELDKHRITGSIDPQNTNSAKLMERLGFRKEAHFLESLYIDGKWVDDIIYAYLKKHWKR
ncbi:GNAT family N-acetyltransferase [bacterium SCSIO 12643]|nr:GNAT family N-acetyltransferase [bacterium SCSIO 12643]